MDSWLRTTEISGPTVCSGPSGHGMYCPADCSCRFQRDAELQTLKDQMHLITETLGIKNLFKTHMRSEGASSVEQATEPSEEATEIFSIAPSVDSRTTDARISRTKLKERVKISRSESRTAKARTEAQNAKRTASRTAPPAADSNTLAQLLLAQTLAGAGVANDAAKVSAITAGVGLDSLLNPTSFRLRQVAKQPKYNRNPRRWLQFQREFKLWVKTQKLQDDQFLMALLDCLEGAPANTWLRTWSDREDTSSPLTFDEVWEQLEVRGSRLPEDHYHQMLKNVPSFSRLILHEVQDKKQRFWNLVEEAEHSGEVGVQSKHRARQFVTKMWVSDCKGNFHLATCLCDNGSEVNLQSNSFLPDDCVIDSLYLVTLEGVSGHSLAGGQRGCYISTHLVAQDLWEEGNVEEVILKDDYFYRADIKYDLYLGHPWLSKNRVAPVGHRRCFLLESGPLERPEFRFLHAGFKSAEEFLKRKVTPKFGEDVTIAEVNGSADYSRELECLRRDSQPRRPSRWHSSSYRVVDKWRDTICEYFYEHHSFWPQYDAFANRENKRFDKHFRDAWTHKWDKKLWINPPFHLIQQVIQKIKQNKTQAILVVPLWDDKPWFQELQDICVDYIELFRMIKLYARDDTGPLPQRSWSSLAFLVDGKLSDSDSADSGTDSCVGSESEVERGTDDESISSDFCPSDAQGDPTSNGSASSPSSPIRSTSKRIFSARAKKNFKSRRKFRVFYEKPRVEAFIDPFEELDHEENLWNVDTRPTYLQRGS